MQIFLAGCRGVIDISLQQDEVGEDEDEDEELDDKEAPERGTASGVANSSSAAAPDSTTSETDMESTEIRRSRGNFTKIATCKINHVSSFKIKQD
jgi:hypothetical protein